MNSLNTKDTYIIPSCPYGWSPTDITIDFTDWFSVKDEGDDQGKKTTALRVKFISNGSGYFIKCKWIDGAGKEKSKYVDLDPDTLEGFGKLLTAISDWMGDEEELALEKTR